MGDDIAKADNAMNAASWIKIGEHSSRDTLKQAVEKIRAKWVGRYDFRICKATDDTCFELRLRHR